MLGTDHFVMLKMRRREPAHCGHQEKLLAAGTQKIEAVLFLNHALKLAQTFQSYDVSQSSSTPGKSTVVKKIPGQQLHS